jgi:putative mRNA 3-end processing factor
VDPTEFPEIDAVITECTYGTIDHQPRIEIEDEFHKEIQDVIDNKGLAVIPAFGVGRSQEILMVIYREGDAPYPVILDGMARKVAFLYGRYPNMLRDPDALSNALNKATIIPQKRPNSERDEALEAPGVIISPSGMLKGGVSRMYAERVQNNENSAIFLVSYQIEDTPGRVLLNTGELVDNDLAHGTPVKSKYRHFDFSSHAGGTELVNFINSLKFVIPEEKRVFCVHGEKDTMFSFADKLREIGFITETPTENQIFNL